MTKKNETGLARLVMDDVMQLTLRGKSVETETLRYVTFNCGKRTRPEIKKQIEAQKPQGANAYLEVKTPRGKLVVQYYRIIRYPAASSGHQDTDAGKFLFSGDTALPPAMWW